MTMHPRLLLLCAMLACHGSRSPSEPSGGGAHAVNPVVVAPKPSATPISAAEKPGAPAPAEMPDAGTISARDRRTGPRCSSADSHCLPLPYWSPELTADAKRAGMRTPPYDPQLSRELIDVSHWDLARGACKADGDCVRNGCGNHCTAWQIQPFAASCPAYTGLSDAHCGCVQGQCGWFAQVPESHFSVSAGQPKTTEPGLSAEKLSRSLPVGWIERQFRDCYSGALEKLPVEAVLRFDLDGRGRLRNTKMVSSDPTRISCLLRAVRQVTLPHPTLPANQRQQVEIPLKLHLDPTPLKLKAPL